MYKEIRCIVLGILLFFSAVFSVFSDEREENIDLFVVLDKSLSMEEEISPVKNYVIDTLIEETLIPGDRFVVIQFYGDAEILIAEDVADSEKKIDFTRTLSSVAADGSYTDIGNALDKLKEAIKDYEHPDRRKYLLLITDGKQEAPEDSKYYSPDGEFNHAFLENAKTIQHEGWKIQVLGIGTASAAKEIAEQLSGGYVETSEEPTQEEITEKTEDLFGTIQIASDLELKTLNKHNETVLTIPLVIEGYGEPQSVQFKNIVLNFEDGDFKNETILSDKTFDLPMSGNTEISFPVTIEQDLPPGTHQAEVRFTFNDLTVITPARAAVTVEVKGFFGNNIWIIPVIAVVGLALIGGLVLLLMRMQKNKPCEFRLYIDNRPAQAAPISLQADESIFLDRDGASYAVARERGDKSVAKITYREEKLRLSTLDPKWFSLPDDLPASVLHEKITAKAKSGLKKELYFKAV